MTANRDGYLSPEEEKEAKEKRLRDEASWDSFGDDIVKDAWLKAFPVLAGAFILALVFKRKK